MTPMVLVYQLSKVKITPFSSISECACVPEALTEKEPWVPHGPVPAALGQAEAGLTRVRESILVAAQATQPLSQVPDCYSHSNAAADSTHGTLQKQRQPHLAGRLSPLVLGQSNDDATPSEVSTL